MNTISVSYAVYWRLKTAEEYQFTKRGICFNVKSGKQIKKVYKSRCIGYNIRGKFKSLKAIRPLLEKIPTKQKLPF